MLLHGLTITPTRARHDDFELTLDDPEVNPVLLHKLASVFGAATEDLADEPPDQVGEQLTAAAKAAEVPGFRIDDRQVIGTFTYAKLPMVRDLQAAGELLGDSDIIAAIAGDPEAQELISADDTSAPATDRARASVRLGSRGRREARRRTTSRCWTPTPRSAAPSTRCWPGAAWSSTDRRAPARARPSRT